MLKLDGVIDFRMAFDDFCGRVVLIKEAGDADLSYILTSKVGTRCLGRVRASNMPYYIEQLTDFGAIECADAYSEGAAFVREHLPAHDVFMPRGAFGGPPR